MDDPPVLVHQGSAVWEIFADWRDRLLAPSAPDWFDLQRDVRADRIKTGDGRTTWRVDMGEAVVFAKVADRADRLSRIKRRLVGAAPRREWQVAVSAYRRGVSVVGPLALGSEDGSSGRIVLLSEGVEPPVDLKALWNRDVQSAGAQRRTAATELIQLTAKCFSTAHEQGFIHADAHAENILVATESSGRRRAVFVDTHGAKLASSAAGLRRSLQSLAHLDQYFHRVATRTDRLRFLQTYFSNRPLFRDSWNRGSVRRAWLTDLAAASAAHAARLARTRDRRLRRQGTYFGSFEVEGNWRVTAALQLERRHVYPETGVPDRDVTAWQNDIGGALAGWASGSTGPSSIDISGLRLDVRSIYGIVARLVATLFGPPERLRFETCHRQRHRDIRNELVLAYATRRRHGLIDAVLLIRPKR